MSVVTTAHGRLREDSDRDKVILAVAKAINAKFDRGAWLEIALMTGTSDLVQEHPRLLRSLDWGDSDYWGHVLEVVPSLLGQRGNPLFLDKIEDLFENFAAVEEFTQLPRADRRHRLFYEHLAAELGISDGHPLRTIRAFDPLPPDIHAQACLGRVLSDPDWNTPPPPGVIPHRVVNYDITDAYEMSFPGYFPAAG